MGGDLWHCFWKSKCISFRQLKRWIYWGLSLNSSKYTYCVYVFASFSTTTMCRSMHSGMSLFSMPSYSWVTHDTTPSVHASRFMHLSCSLHSYIWVSTWNTIFEHWRITTALCVFVLFLWWWLCVCDFLIRKVSDRAVLFTEFWIFISCLPMPMRISNKRQHGQIWRKLTGELCVSVCAKLWWNWLQILVSI